MNNAINLSCLRIGASQSVMYFIPFAVIGLGALSGNVIDHHGVIRDLCHPSSSMLVGAAVGVDVVAATLISDFLKGQEMTLSENDSSIETKKFR